MTAIQIYITTKVITKSPVKARPAAAFAASLTYRDQQKTLTAAKYEQTSHAVLLTALIDSLKVLKRHDLPIIIALPASDVLTALNQQTYVVWQQNDWQVDQHPVADKSLWQAAIKLINQFPDLTLTASPATTDATATQATKLLQETLSKL